MKDILQFFSNIDLSVFINMESINPGAFSGHLQVLIIGIITVFAPLVIALIVSALNDKDDLKMITLIDESERLFVWFLIFPLVIITLLPILPILEAPASIILMVVTVFFILWKNYKYFGRFVAFTKDTEVLLIPYIERLSKQKKTEDLKNVYEKIFLKGFDEMPQKYKIVGIFTHHIEKCVEEKKFRNAVLIAETCKHYGNSGKDLTCMHRLFDGLLSWNKIIYIEGPNVLEDILQKKNVEDSHKEFFDIHALNRIICVYIQNISRNYTQYQHQTFSSLKKFTQETEEDFNGTRNEDVSKRCRSLLEEICQYVFDAMFQNTSKRNSFSYFPEGWKITPETIDNLMPRILFEKLFQDKYFFYFFGADDDSTFKRSNMITTFFPGIDQGKFYLFCKILRGMDAQEILEGSSIYTSIYSGVFRSQEDVARALEKNSRESQEKTINLIYKILDIYPIPSSSKEDRVIYLSNFEQKIKNYIVTKEENRREAEVRKKMLIRMINTLVKKIENED